MNNPKILYCPDCGGLLDEEDGLCDQCIDVDLYVGLEDDDEHDEEDIIRLEREDEFLKKIHTVNCTICGIPNDITQEIDCVYCGTPLK